MTDVIIYINNGNEAFGTTGKTITVDEEPKNISLDFVSDELQHRMPLVPMDVIRQVLVGFGDVAARLMAEGFAIQMPNSKDEVLLRYYVDARLKCQSINLQKARELMPDDVTDEASMVAHAGELVALAGVQLRPYVEVRNKFHDLLAEYKPKYEVKRIAERPYVAKKDGTSPTPNPSPSGEENDSSDSSDNGGGSNDGNGGGNGGIE